MRFAAVSFMTLSIALFLAAPVGAQDARSSSGEQIQPSSPAASVEAAMDAAAAAHTSSVAEERADLARVLAQVEVRELALAHGIDMDRVESAAAVLSDAQVKQVTPLVAKVTPLMQRSMGTVTISVAAIIIILLILILVS